MRDLKKDDQLFGSISEICTNLIQGNIKLTSKQKAQLKPYKQLIVTCAVKSKSKANKRKLIVQSGGAFLPALIPIIKIIAASAVGEYIGSKIKDKFFNGKR